MSTSQQSFPLVLSVLPKIGLLVRGAQTLFASVLACLPMTLDTCASPAKTADFFQAHVSLERVSDVNLHNYQLAPGHSADLLAAKHSIANKSF